MIVSASVDFTEDKIKEIHEWIAGEFDGEAFEVIEMLNQCEECFTLIFCESGDVENFYKVEWENDDPFDYMEGEDFTPAHIGTLSKVEPYKVVATRYREI